MLEDYSQIVVITSSELDTQFIKSTLKGATTHSPKCYQSGRRLISNIKSKRLSPDLIVTDLVTSDIDYFHLVRELDHHRISCDLLLVSDLDSRILGTAKQMGENFGYSVVGTLTKPFTLEDIRWSLRERNIKPMRGPVKNPDQLSQTDILGGLRDGSLCVHYQPKWDVQKNQISGFEALSRWRDGDKILSPLAFIPVAERCGLIDALSWNIAEIVLSDAQRFFERFGNIQLAINFSVSTLQDISTPDKLEKLCVKYKVPTKNVTIEVTETRISEDGIALLEVLSRLHLNGFKLSIDDFGTGFSSLYRVKALPFSELKVDRSFVHGIEQSQTCQAVLASSMSLARELGMVIVAEGVETDDELAYLKQNGCEQVQGFLKGKPQDIEHWLAPKLAQHTQSTVIDMKGASNEAVIAVAAQ